MSKKKGGLGGILRVVAPVAALAIPGVGPLASAALSAGAGALATKITGGSWGDSLKAGALSGLGGLAAPVIGGALSSAFPETTAALGLAPSMAASSNGGSSFLSNLFGSSASNAVGSSGSDIISGGVGMDTLGNSAANSSGLIDKAWGFAKEHPLMTAGALTALTNMGGSEETEAEKASAAVKASEARKLEDIKDALSGSFNRNRIYSPNIDYANYGMGGGRQFFDVVNPGIQQFKAGGSVKKKDAYKASHEWDDDRHLAFAEGGASTWMDPRDENQRAARALGYSGPFGAGGISEWRINNGITDAMFKAAGAVNPPSIDAQIQSRTGPGTTGNKPFNDNPKGASDLWMDPRDANQTAARNLGYTGQFGGGGIEAWRIANGITDEAFTKAGASGFNSINSQIKTGGTEVKSSSPLIRTKSGANVNYYNYGSGPGANYFKYTNPNASPTTAADGTELWYDPRDVNQQTARDLGYKGAFGGGGITDWRKQMGITDEEFNTAGANFSNNSGIIDIPSLNPAPEGSPVHSQPFDATFYSNNYNVNKPGTWMIPRDDNQNAARSLGYAGNFGDGGITDWRKQNSIKDWEFAGSGAHDFPVLPELQKAKGGKIPGDSSDKGQPRHFSGQGGGQDDDIDAKLSAGEFVIPADVVAHLGDGNNDAGAERLHEFMDAIRSHKAGKGHPPKAKKAQQYLKGDK